MALKIAIFADFATYGLPNLVKTSAGTGQVFC